VYVCVCARVRACITNFKLGLSRYCLSSLVGMASLQICEYHRFMAEHLSSLFSISTVLFLVLVNLSISIGFVAVVEDHLCQMDAVKRLLPIFFPKDGDRATF
jgi:hypothetical protein